MKKIDKLPLVSVVIPTYSRNDMLKRAIESILNQTYKNIEIIVVDDNPPESTFRKENEYIMNQYSGEEKIRYIKNKQNLGGALARNEGILNSRGEIICFLDDDDEYLPECVEEKVNLFVKSKNEKLALVYGMCEIVDCKRNKSFIFGNKFRGNCIYELLKIDCIAATSQWACRKDALMKIGMFTDIPAKQDSMLMLKLFELNYEIDYVDKPLSRFYVHDGVRISNSGKAVDGEIELRKYGRRLYDRLTASDILDVEFEFAARMTKYYMNKTGSGDIIEEMRTMYRIYPVRSIKITFVEMLKKIKHRLVDN